MDIKIKLKNFIQIIVLFCALTVFTNLTANNKDVPIPFQGQDNNSTISISYDDFSKVLGVSVLDMGKSKRSKAPRTIAKIGTRVKNKRKTIYTALEGNRFLFTNFESEDNKLILTTIRKSLEKVPDEVLMSQLNAREQLAFWLNLYNISLIEQLVAIYPKFDLESELYDRDGIMDNKFLNVSGIELSLNDIQNKIIFGKFSANPLVIYGFFQGIIGGPNIRTTAYTGKTVIKQLRKNASEFINSNRGIYVEKKGTLRVSSYYKKMEQFFQNFEFDLKKHLKFYVDDNYLSHLENSKRITANIKIMRIVDLNGGKRKMYSASANNMAALLDSAAATGMINVVGGNDGFV